MNHRSCGGGATCNAVPIDFLGRPQGQTPERLPHRRGGVGPSFGYEATHRRRVNASERVAARFVHILVQEYSVNGERRRFAFLRPITGSIQTVTISGLVKASCVSTAFEPLAHIGIG
jgi:hypothetical protein